MARNDPNNPVTYFAETDFRNRRTRFGIKAEDRARHVYIIGKTGMGKSTLLENMAVQDIQNGEGMAFMDPHGQTAEKLLDYVPASRVKDVIYFAPFDIDFPISFNVMEDVGYDKRHLVASGLMSTFKKIWVDAWSARMEYILNNILLSLLEYPDSTLLGVNRMLSDKDFRKKVVDNITDPAVKSFWVDEFAKYGDRYMQEAGAAIQNKIGQFTSNPVIRNIIGQSKSSFDIRQIMDNKKILIINLSKGRVGEQNASLLGGMLITKLYLSAMSRADVPVSVLKTLPRFYFYVDEFQSFANESFADILSEARKYKLNLTMAHQYIEQMAEEVRAAVFGNVGTTIAFRVGPFDAEVLEKIFFPTFTKEDIVNLGFAQIYLTLMVDGIGSKPFSALTLPPIPEETISNKDVIIRNSRETFARARKIVEEEIKKWHEPVERPVRLPTGEGERSPGSFKPSNSNFVPRENREFRGPARVKDMNRVESFKTMPKPNTPPNTLQNTQPNNQPKHFPFKKELNPENLRNQHTAKIPAKTFSLADLQKKNEERKEDKGPSEKNSSALKDLLAKVSSENKTATNPSTNPVPSSAPKPMPNPNVNSGNNFTKPEHGIKEVPEHVLRKVLE